MCELSDLEKVVTLNGVHQVHLRHYQRLVAPAQRWDHLHRIRGPFGSAVASAERAVPLLAHRPRRLGPRNRLLCQRRVGQGGPRHRTERGQSGPNLGSRHRDAHRQPRGALHSEGGRGRQISPKFPHALFGRPGRPGAGLGRTNQPSSGHTLWRSLRSRLLRHLVLRRHIIASGSADSKVMYGLIEEGWGSFSQRGPGVHSFRSDAFI